MATNQGCLQSHVYLTNSVGDLDLTAYKIVFKISNHVL